MALSRQRLRSHWVLVLVACVMSATSCTQPANSEELEVFIQTALGRKPVRLAMRPMVARVDRFVYSAAGLRSPFERPPALEAWAPSSEGVAPEFLRKKEALESSLLSDLSMVGFLSFDGQILGLVETLEGELSRVSRGSYLGLNYGRIWRVRHEGIDLVEIVPSGDGGWIERPQTLALRQHGEGGGVLQ